MLADPWQVDIQELFEAFVNEPDEIKRNLYDSLPVVLVEMGQLKYIKSLAGLHF